MGYIKMNKIFITMLVVVVFGAGDLCAKPCYTPSGKKVNCKTLAEAKKVLALKKLIEQNKALKAELSATRKAELVSAATTPAVTPDTQKLAPVTSTSIPAQASTPPTATIKTEVAKPEEKSGFEKDFSAAVENSTSRPFQDETDIYNSMKFIFKYNLTDNINIKSEPSFNWAWASKSNFQFQDLPFALNHGCLYYSSSLDMNISGSFVISLPTSSGSRNAGVISYVISNVVTKFGFNDGKGSLTLTPEIAFAFRKRSTSSPTADSLEDFNSLSTEKRSYFGSDQEGYEELDPYSQYTLSLNTSFWHQVYGIVSFATWVKFFSTKMYGDYVNDGGQIRTITPESWNNTMEFSQEIKFKVNDRFVVKTGLSSLGPVSGFRPFNTNNGNNLIAWVTIKYDFYNVTDPF
jgi:hypothetical protein